VSGDGKWVNSLLVVVISSFLSPSLSLATPRAVACGCLCVFLRCKDAATYGEDGHTSVYLNRK